MFISELLNMAGRINDDVGRGNLSLIKKNIKSISSYSSKAIYYFPMVVSDQCTAEEVAMLSKAMEKQYSTFVVTCIGLIPFHRISSRGHASVDEYLNIFHQNIGIDAPADINILPMFESAEGYKDFRTYEKAYELGLVKNREEYDLLANGGLSEAVEVINNFSSYDKAYELGLVKDQEDYNTVVAALSESVEIINEYRGFEKAYELGLVKSRKDYDRLTASGKIFNESAEVINNFQNFEKAYELGLDKDRKEYTMMVDEAQYTPLNEMYSTDQMDKYTRHLYNRRNGIGAFDGVKDQGLTEASISIRSDAGQDPKHNITGASPSGNYNAFDSKAIFTNQDMNKANEMIPTIAKVNVGFIVEDTNEVISRDVLVGIKTFVHRIQSSELVTAFYQTIMNKRKFLKFVKFTTGEEKSLTDLILGVGELKSDAIESKLRKSSWLQAFKRRRRWSKMTIPFLMKSYTPNGTVVMTMNEVEFIKDRYGIDIMRDGHIKMIMEANFLLGFVILDQTNEVAYISYDSHNYEPQEYSYNLLEREMNANDRVMRELYRTFSTR